MSAHVEAVHRSATHAFSKAACAEILLEAGHGVVGDAHAGVTVQHRSRVARDPSQPNLRQVHLLQAELLDSLALAGLPVRPGQMGENISTRGVDLLALPQGTLLHLGPAVVVQITGLRNPCGQIEQFMPGLLAAVLGRDDSGALVRKAGVMGIVLTGGRLCAGDTIKVALPALPHLPLLPV